MCVCAQPMRLLLLLLPGGFTAFYHPNDTSSELSQRHSPCSDPSRCCFNTSRCIYVHAVENGGRLDATPGVGLLSPRCCRLPRRKRIDLIKSVKKTLKEGCCEAGNALRRRYEATLLDSTGATVALQLYLMPLHWLYVRSHIRVPLEGSFFICFSCQRRNQAKHFPFVLFFLNPFIFLPFLNDKLERRQRR